MANEVTILIPTYFAGTMLYNCLDSIYKNIPNAQVITFKNDIGWLQAANHLLALVDTDVILMNDDTIVLTDIVKEMRNLAYSDDTIAIVGAKMLSPNQETVINYGIYIGKDGNTAHKHFGDNKNKVNKIEIQKAVEGSCMYIKREALKSIGYFDEGYGKGYREEVDLCLRAKEAGWKIVSCPTAEVIHFTNQTHGKLGITNDSYDYFMSKWATKLKLGVV